MAHCLIVDDSKVIRKVARHIIEGLGLSVEEAEDGSVALEACRARSFDLILLDWNMPVMNGLEFLRGLRMEPGGKGPKVIFCTVENEVAAIREALESGADEYIMKPFDSEIMAAKFAQAGLT